MSRLAAMGAVEVSGLEMVFRVACMAALRFRVQEHGAWVQSSRQIILHGDRQACRQPWQRDSPRPPRSDFADYANLQGILGKSHLTM